MFTKPGQVHHGRDLIGRLHFRRVDRVDHLAHFFGRSRLLADKADANIAVLKMPRGFIKRYSAAGAEIVLDVEIAGGVLRMRIPPLHMGDAQRWRPAAAEGCRDWAHGLERSLT